MKNRLLKKETRVRRQTVFDAYSLEEAYHVLLAYRNGEIGVSPFVREANERQLASGFQLDEAFLCALLQSIALIGHLVISKYCKGETPRAERLVCETGLTLAKRLASHGLLLEYGHGGDVIIGGYAFRCRLYFAHCTGVLLIPEQPGKKTEGYFGSFPRWTLQRDTWPLDEELAKEIILYCAALF